MISNNFQFTVNGITINVKRPEKDFKKWSVNSKENLNDIEVNIIINKFEKKFPHISLREDTFEALNSFWQMSDECNNLKNALSEKYKADMEKLKSAQYDNLGAILRENYKMDMQNLENQKKALFDKILAKNSILTILLLDNTELSISISDAIDNYLLGNDSLEAVFQRQLYQNEVLINYKIALLEIIHENPDVDVYDILNQLRYK